MRTRAWVPALLLACCLATEASAEDPASFAGEWDTDYGLLALSQKGAKVTGHYGGANKVEGTVAGRKLTFTYTEANAAGEGWFELAGDGQRIRGKWRETGAEEWSDWSGKLRGPLRETGPLDGVYETEFGRVRLVQGKGSEVTGLYAYSGRIGRIEGTAKDRQLTFTWTEGSSKGYGEFAVAEDGLRLTGRWRGASGSEWQAWNGERVVPRPGVVWLTILEAQWEQGLAEQEYSFGEMLRSFFRRYPHVQVRQRRINDRADLLRAAQEVPLLAEPVVLLLSMHGSEGELQAGPDSVPAADVAQALAGAGNLELVHFSSCEMLIDGVPEAFRKAIGWRVPLSGYGVSVDWSGSALLEFLYLDMLVGRRMSVSRAAEIVRKELRFAGDTPTPGSPIGEAKFRLVE